MTETHFVVVVLYCFKLLICFVFVLIVCGTHSLLTGGLCDGQLLHLQQTRYAVCCACEAAASGIKEKHHAVGLIS